MRAKIAFCLVFSLVLLLAGLANAVPYLNTRGAYQHDGQEVAGFPWPFRKIGGDCGAESCDTYAFHAGYFAADAAVGLAAALALGSLAAWGFRPRRQRG